METTIHKTGPARFTFTTPTAVIEYNSQWKGDLSKAQNIIYTLENVDSSEVKAKGHLIVLEPLNDFFTLFDANQSVGSLLSSVHPSKDIRDSGEQAEQAFKKLRDEVKLSVPIYGLVSAIDLEALEKAGQAEKDTLYWVQKIIRDYKREGIDRDAETREKVNELKRRITEVGLSFERTIAEDTRSVQLPESALDGLPDDFTAKHPVKNGMVTITTDYPDWVPFMQYAKDSDARKALYIQYNQRGYPKNAGVMLEMFNKRQELANLLGFASFADYRLEVEMIGSGKNVQDFIDRISGLAENRAERDSAELLDAKKSLDPKHSNDDKVHVYEARHLEQGLKKTKYNFDSQAARQYFPFGRVRDGIMASMAELFAIRFKKVECDVWHPDVITYEVHTEDKLTGRFYLDLHPRENKYKHVAEFEVRTGTKTQLPEAAFVCNFPPGDDSLMEHSEVTTFFHEFGHLLHHLFSSQRWTAIGAITCDFDFIEAPSQMLEEWSFDPTTLKRFAINAKGEVLPDEMITALRRSRGQGRGLQVKQQMFYAGLSLHYHLPSSHLTSPESLDEVLKTMTKRYAPYDYVPDTHFMCSFGHLQGYSTGYYAYMWSQVIAQDLFTRFQQKGLYDQTVAREYKAKVLAKGGSEDARDFVKGFLGRDYSFDAFGRYLQEGA